MGKATFYRKQKLGCVNYLVVFLPLIGGTLFLVGSLFFWPGFGIYQHELRHLGPDGRPILAEHAEDMGNSTTTHRLCLFYSRYFDENHTFRLEHDQCAELMEWIGALAFLLGSACYFLAPLIDWIELKMHASNHANPPVKLVERVEDLNPAERYEHLYTEQLHFVQRTNILIYCLGGIFFIGGSVFFFPSLSDFIVHGGWLYITGCVLTLLGASLAAATAWELRKTSQKFVHSERWLLGCLGDEEATLISCALYILGSLIFIVGSALFFDDVLDALAPTYGVAPVRLAVVLFVAGSAVFLLGALIDVIVVVRSDGRFSDPTPVFDSPPALAPKLARGLTQPTLRTGVSRCSAGDTTAPPTTELL